MHYYKLTPCVVKATSSSEELKPVAISIVELHLAEGIIVNSVENSVKMEILKIS